MSVYIQVYNENGFYDEYHSNIIRRIFEEYRGKEFIYKEDTTDREFYGVTKENLKGLYNELCREYTMQEEKCMFKKKGNNTLRELHILKGIFRYIKDDDTVKDTEKVLVYEIREEEVIELF